ncbi:hypothetical protein ACG83_36710 [Frankia sp. R43]|nr:hypothetical protein ACG83_36710 [Frankia sp. R43]
MNGSGISLGHPLAATRSPPPARRHRLAATGGRIPAALPREMHRRDARYALETLCIRGGPGMAAVSELVR